jgi:hypothetical protein
MRALPVYGDTPYIRIPKDMIVTSPARNDDTEPADDDEQDIAQATAGMPDEGTQDDEAAQKIALVNSSTDEELRGAKQ